MPDKPIPIPDEAIGLRKIWRKIGELARQAAGPSHLAEVAKHIGTPDPTPLYFPPVPAVFNIATMPARPVSSTGPRSAAYRRRLCRAQARTPRAPMPSRTKVEGSGMD